MLYRIHILFVLFNFIIGTGLIDAQSQSNIIQTKGKEFCLGFMDQYDFSNAIGTKRLDIFISGQVATTGTLTIPGQNYTQNFTITPNVTTTLNIPNLIAEHESNETIDNKAIFIVTKDTVSVYAINFQQYTADGTLVLPINSLGTEYRITSYIGLTTYLYPTLLIVATENNTLINITPSTNTLGGHLAGVTYSILLNRGQSYQMKTSSTLNDFSGTLIKSDASSGACRPFAVFTGNMCTNIPSGCTACDALFEQEIPINIWGKKFMMAPFKNTTHFTYKILSSQNNTQISVNGSNIGIFNAGQIYQANSVNTPIFVVADKPVAVSQFMEGQTCSTIGDPMQILINDINQKMNEVTFSTVNSTILNNHVVNVIIKTSDIPQLKLDGLNVGGGPFLNFPANPVYSYAQITLNSGSHTLQADSGFYAYSYGTGNCESYGYALGSFTEIHVIPTDTIFCTNNPVTLSPPIVLNNPQWTAISNPSQVFATTQSITVIPNHSDTYIINGYNLQSGCLEEYHFTIEIPVNPLLTVSSSQDTVCQYGQVQLNVEAQPSSSIYNYHWTPSIGLSDPSIKEPVATPPYSMWYYCEVSTPSGCAYSRDSVYVSIRDGSVSNVALTASETSYCVTGNSQLNIQTEKILVSDDFNSTGPATFWSIINNGLLSNTCGSVNGNALYFTGGTARYATTIPLNVLDGGTIYFSLKIANGVIPCDDAESGENIVLEYSTNGGISYNTILTCLENQFPNFSTQSIVIPSAARTTSTIFRWRQPVNSGNNQDNWALDNVYFGVISEDDLIYLWTPQIGLSASNISNPIASPFIPTNYQILILDSVTGCEYRDSVFIDVGQQFTLNTSDDLILCQTSGIQIQTSPNLIGNYTYSWTPSATLSNSNLSNPIATPFHNTTYIVNVVSTQGCVNSDTVNVFVPTLVNFYATPNCDSVCSGSSLQMETFIEPICGTTGHTCITTTNYQLGTAATTTSANNQTIYHGSTNSARVQLLITKAELNAMGIFNPSTITQLGFNISSIAGSNIYQGFTIKMGCTSLNAFTANYISGLQLVYNPKNILLSSGVNYYVFDNTYDWDGNSNIIVEICFENSVTSANSGIYYTTTSSYKFMIYSGTSSCNYPGGILSYQRPNIYLKLCEANSNYNLTYSWSPSLGLSNDTISNPIATTINSTTYIIEAFDSLTGCMFKDSVRIHTGEDFSILLNDSITNCTTNGVHLSAIPSFPGNYSYIWSPATSLSSANIQNPIASPASTTNYIVTVTSSDGCIKMDTTTVYVNVPYLFSFNANPEMDTICFGQQIQLEAVFQGGCGANPSLCTGSLSTGLIGTGGATSAMNNITVYKGAFQSSKMQFLYKKSELNSAGIFGPTTFRELGFNVSTVLGSNTYNGFTIKIKCTSSNSLTNSFESNTIQVFNPKTITITNGINYYLFDVGYNWDGVSNIIVEICFSNLATSSNSIIFYNNTTYNSVVYTTGAGVCNSSTGIVGVSRPYTYFKYCMAPTLYPLQYSWLPSIGLSSDTISNPIASNMLNITYFITAFDTVSGCVMSDSVKLVTGNPVDLNLGPDTMICEGESLVLNAPNGFDTYQWSDNSNGNSLQVDTPGIYWIIVTDICGQRYDTISIQSQGTSPHVELGNDTVLCIGSGFTLNAYDSTINSYLWQDNSTDSVLEVLNAGTYYVTVVNNCGYAKDSINVYFDYPKVIDLGQDTILCNSDSIQLNAGSGFSSYLWNNGSTDSTVIVYNSGYYYLQANNTCSSEKDTILVTFVESPIVNLGNDTVLCMGDTFLLNVYSANISQYLWQNGDTDSIFEVNHSGVYFVNLNNYCGSVSDTIVVDSLYLPALNLGNDTSLCQYQTLNLNVYSPLFDYYDWSDGVTDSIRNISNSGIYSIQAGNICGISKDTISIYQILDPVVNLQSSSILCEDENLILDAFAQQNENYLWNTGDTTTQILISTGGLYAVTVSNICNMFSDTTIVSFYQFPITILPNDTIICEGSSLILDPIVHNSTEYLWQNGSNDTSIVASQQGIFWVEVTNPCGISRDSILINQLLLPYVNLLDSFNICYGDTAVLDVSAVQNLSYLWNTGDTTDLIYLTNEGNYSVTVSNSCGVANDSIYISVLSLPVVILPADTSICEGTNFILSPIVQYAAEYQWQDSSIDTVLVVTQPGIYWVELTNICGNERDSIHVNNITLPLALLPEHEIICDNDSILLDVYLEQNNSYLWNTGSTESHIYTSTPGVYYVYVENNCGEDRDTVIVDSNMIPVVGLSSDTVICPGTQILLDPSVIGTGNYLWQNGSSDSVLYVTTYGEFWVQVQNECGFDIDTIIIKSITQPYLNLGVDTSLCVDENLTLGAINGFYTFLWSTGSSDSSITVSSSGVYSVVAQGVCGQSTDSIKVDFYDYPEKPFTQDTINYCNSDTLLLDAENLGSTFIWSTGDIDQQILVSQNGEYSVIINNRNCITYDTLNVIFKNVGIIINDSIQACDNHVSLKPYISGADFYLWSTGASDSSIVVNSTGNYSIEAFNEFCYAVKNIYVLIIDEQADLFPNIFSPNDDGSNDEFKPYETNLIDYQLVVYNRWGQSMFQSADPDMAWDGKFEGNPVASGVYYWTVTYFSYCENAITLKKGFVTLVR